MAKKINRDKVFTWTAGDYEISQCADCRHKRVGATCAAFPSGIPKAILLNEHDHRKPYPSASKPTDNGIRFQSKKRLDK